MNPLLTNLLPAITSVLDRVIPDKNKRAEVEAELKGKLLEQENKILETLASSDKQQTEINKIEAGSQHWFVVYWRPAVGWCGVFGLAWACVLQPMLTWSMVMVGQSTATPPEIDSGTLMTILTGILGLGAYRTYEKTQRINLNKVK